MDQDDPADWSIDRVIQEICFTKSPAWAAGTNLKQIINADTVAKALRDNDIDGDNLLALKDENVKADLGIISFGQRRNFNSVVSHLRTLSSKYKEHPSSISLTESTAPPFSRASDLSDGRSLSYAGSGIPDSAGLNKADGSKQDCVYDDSLEQLKNGVSRKRKLEEMHPLINKLNGNHAEAFQETTDQSQSFLGSLDTAIDQELNNNAKNIAECSVAHYVSPMLTTLPSKRAKLPKRVVPTLVTDRVPSLQHIGNSSFKDRELSTSSSFQRSSIRDTFEDQQTDASSNHIEPFHKSGSSQQIPPLALSEVQNTHRTYLKTHRKDFIACHESEQSFNTSGHEYTDPSANFQLFGNTSSSSLTQRALKSVKALAMSAPVLLVSSISATTNPAQNSAAPFRRQQSSTSEWAQNNPTLDLPIELQRMVAKYAISEEDSILPLYGESENEDREWTSEPETPPPDVPKSKLAFSVQELEMIIDEAVEDFKRDWRIRSLARAQHKAYKKWLTADKNKIMRARILDDCINWKTKSRDQIKKLRGGIHLSEWRKAEDVKHQCLAFEASVHRLEEYTLYVDVLSGKEKPMCPSPQPVNRREKSRPRTILPNGDEELDSDSADSFVVADESDLPIDKELSLFDHTVQAWSPKLVNEPHALTEELITTSNANVNDTILDSIEDVQGHSISMPMSSNVVNVEDADNDITEVAVTDHASSVQNLQKSMKKHTAIESAMRNPIYLPELTDSGEESDFDRKSRAQGIRFRRSDRSGDNEVDLIILSPLPTSNRYDSMEICTPDLNTSGDHTFGLPSNGSHGSRHASSLAIEHGQSSRSQSLIMDVERVTGMNWDDIEPNKFDAPNIQLMLAKSVYDLSMHYTHRLLDYVRSFRLDDDMEDMLGNGLLAAKEGDDSIADVEKKNQDNAQRLTELFICYATGCRPDDDFDIPEQYVDEAYAVLKDGVTNFRSLLQRLMQNHISCAQPTPPENDLSVDDSSADVDTDDGVLGLEKRKRRTKKRFISYAEEVARQQTLQKSAYRDLEKKREQFLRAQAERGVSQEEIFKLINVNTPAVYLDTKIAKEVKPHQMQGIRFLWREIIENPKGQGCLLAHTMGLGKTMQVISLLVTISKCNESNDPAVRDHIPPHLRRLRVLILCPMSLIDNWFEELLKWLPDVLMLGPITKLDRKHRVPHMAVQAWIDEGGVLITSYERFTLYTNPPPNPRKRQPNPESLRSNLLDGPDIVIADEAHKFKNAKSKVNQSVQQIRTKSRVAMTGSPINNYLEEYHTMIDWISPGYLGNISHFRAKYIVPIGHGLYSESSTWERKASLKKLHVLKRTLASLVDRADITAISKDLPPKTEFFLTITLTDEQKQAYELYVQELRKSYEGKGKLGNTRVWSWLSVLSLLINHPFCFVEKLLQCKDLGPSPAAQHTTEDEAQDRDEVGGSLSAEDVNLAEQPVLTSAMQTVLNVFTEAKVLLRMDDPSLSNKSLLIKHILEEAVRLGEKTLIFSKSIPTLNYYEKMVKSMGLGFKRIDGTDKYAKGSSRQNEVAQFNNSDDFKVFLISTRAGGLGLNIQSASRVIVNDFDFNPAWEEQAIGRAYRIGQKKPVFIYRFLVGGTFEELIHNKAVFKTQLSTRVVDEKNVVAQAARNPGEFLFDPKEIIQKNFDECLGKDPHVLDRVLQKVTCVRDIFLTETFFQDNNEQLNEQELKEANEELELERLERENPEEYARKMRAKHTLVQGNISFQPATSAHALRSQLNDIQQDRFIHFFQPSIPYQPYSSFLMPSATSVLPLPLSMPPGILPRASFGDDYVPSTRSTNQFTQQVPSFMDDQAIPNIHELRSSICPTTTVVTSRSQRSPYFGTTPSIPASNNSVNFIASAEGQAPVQALSEASEKPSGTEDDNSTQPSGCRPQ